MLPTLPCGVDLVRSVVFSPDGALLATCTRDERVRVSDTARGALLHQLRGVTGAQCAAAFHPRDASLLAVCSTERTLRLYQL
jgi:WD40 repeat protein